jgi:DNA polymerase III epsilon subunit-like protein
MRNDMLVGDGLQTPTVYNRDQLVFSDFEASGLERGSWPIEIGIVEIRSDGSVRVQSNLIRPHPSWREELWSPASAQIHGIFRERVDSAHPAEIIAAEYIELIAAKTLVSDTPEFDGPWLDKLAATISATKTFNILGFNAVIAQFGFAGIKRAFNYLNAEEPPHRACEDAARLAKALLTASEGGK